MDNIVLAIDKLIDGHAVITVSPQGDTVIGFYPTDDGRVIRRKVDFSLPRLRDRRHAISRDSAIKQLIALSKKRYYNFVLREL